MLKLKISLGNLGCLANPPNPKTTTQPTHGRLICLGERGCGLHDTENLMFSLELFKDSNSKSVFILEENPTLKEILRDSSLLTLGGHDDDFDKDGLLGHAGKKMEKYEKPKFKPILLRRFPSHISLSLPSEKNSSSDLQNHAFPVVRRSCSTSDDQAITNYQCQPTLATPKSAGYSYVVASKGRIKMDPNFRLQVDKEGRVEVFAGVLDRGAEFVVDNDSTLFTTPDGLKDALFTRDMVLLWSPLRCEWLQVSIKGRLYSIPDPFLDIPTMPHHAPAILTDGCLLFSNDQTYMFKSGPQHQPPPPVWPNLTCPVSLDKIPTSRIHVALEGCTCPSIIPLPLKWRRHKSRSKFPLRPWYFSECGHVFAWHRELSGYVPWFIINIRYNLCPTCRSEGFFRPLLHTPIPELCVEVPDTVLVPCGCVLGRREAWVWKEGVAVPFSGDSGLYWRHSCPFCKSRIEAIQPLYIC